MSIVHLPQMQPRKRLSFIYSNAFLSLYLFSLPSHLETEDPNDGNEKKNVCMSSGRIKLNDNRILAAVHEMYDSKSSRNSINIVSIAAYELKEKKWS